MATLSEQELKRQVELLAGDCEALYSAQELGQRLKSAAETGRQLRVKLGLDPTAPDIHLGHTVVLGKIRQFQDLGHKAVLIIGDYTARIGDPTGVNKTRPMLTPEQIEVNARTYMEQAGKVLDTSPEKLEVRRNSEWLEKLSLMELIQIAAKKTVAQMLQRESFKNRLAAEDDVFLHEFLYPIMQGYDSVVVKADVELGGTDQTFNNLVGRDLQKAYSQPPQIVMIMPILVGLDGVQKMSKSKGNYIGVTDDPNDMFGKVMSIPDALMGNYFRLLAGLGMHEIAELTDSAKTHPRQAKERLGRAIVEKYHGPAAAAAAVEEFARVFSQKQVPADMPEIAAPAAPVNVMDLIVSAGFAKSKSNAKQLIEQGAVSLDGERLADFKAMLEVKPGQVLRVGKLKFGKIVVK